MKLNEEILKMFKETGIKEDDGVCYLLSLFLGYQPSYIPEEIKKRVNALGIVKQDLNSLNWTKLLFETQETKFSWVKDEYVELFKKANYEKRGNVREAIIRMKRFFMENPDVRKDEIIEATKLYLENTNIKYIMFPHYFIFKGVGASKTYNLLNWIEKLREEKEEYRESDRRKLL